jgi:CHAT domain-containing protein
MGIEMTKGKDRNPIAWTIILILLVSGCAVSQPEFEISGLSVRRAIYAGRTKEALAFYEAAAQEAERSALSSTFPQQQWERASAAYKYASQTARQSGDFQKALVYGEKALETAQRTKEPRYVLNALQELIWAHASVRNFDKASETLAQALEVVKQLPLNTNLRASWEGILNDELGREFMRKQEYLKAADAYLAAIDWYRTWISRLKPNSLDLQTARTNILLTSNRLGDAYRRAGELDHALEQYQQAFNSIHEWSLRYPFENGLYEGMGEIYLEQRQFPQALDSFQKALALAERQRRPVSIGLASGRIAYTLREMGKPEDALPYSRQAIEQIESIRSLLDSPADRQSYFEGAMLTYGNAIVASLASKRWAEAFDYSERARSRAFLDVLGTKAQLSKTRSELFAEERALNERIAGLKSRLSTEPGEADTASLRAELRDAERAYNGFLTKVSRENKEQASLMSVKPLTSHQVQELLDPETTLISYFVTRDFVRVWIVEKNRLRYVRVRLSKKELADLVREFRETIYTLGESERFRKVSETLHKDLIEPVTPYVRAKEVIIVPHDVLNYLPFHALVDRDGRYLIEKYPIYYLSSASLLQFTKEKRTAMGEKVLAFGNPDLGDPERDLEFAELEAQEVRNIYPQSRVYVQKEATEEKSKALSPSHDILHFAAHTELNEEDPLSSAILLAKEGKEDGKLEVREIFGMDLKANLVVLSGCETGLGKLSRGDELVGLTRAFIYAGTPSVVASLWKVDDSSTAQLMAEFYRNLKTMTKVEALRQAQLQLIRGQGRSDLFARRGVGGITKFTTTQGVKPTSGDAASPFVSTSHPYFWAPFILVGDGK